MYCSFSVGDLVGIAYLCVDTVGVLTGVGLVWVSFGSCCLL